MKYFVKIDVTIKLSSNLRHSIKLKSNATFPHKRKREKKEKEKKRAILHQLN